MSMTFTKLFSSITESTVWCEPDRTRLVWITMLAMTDRNGRVWASIPGLANRARVPLNDARIAIATFLAPDQDSRTPDNDGRRIEQIDGGWRLLNYAKYRAIRDEENVRESKRKYINARREKERCEMSAVDNVDRSRDNAEAEAEAEAEAFCIKSTPLSGRPDVSPPEKKKNEGNTKYFDEAQGILSYLNEATGKGFEFRNRSGQLTASADKIIQRLKQGYTPLELREVVHEKCSQWAYDDRMSEYLRPATLFGKEKFEQYIGELKGAKNG